MYWSTKIPHKPPQPNIWTHRDHSSGATSSSHTLTVPLNWPVPLCSTVEWVPYPEPGRRWSPSLDRTALTQSQVTFGKWVTTLQNVNEFSFRIRLTKWSCKTCKLFIALVPPQVPLHSSVPTTTTENVIPCSPRELLPVYLYWLQQWQCARQ